MRIVFVTTELEPLTPGGAGVVVARLAERLAVSMDVTVVLIGDAAAPSTFPYSVAAVVPDDDTAEARSAAAASALGELGLGSGDRVEFQDFEGLGYEALRARDDLGLDRTLVTVRVHGPTDRLLASIDLDPPAFRIQRAMERGALEMADLVVAPSEPLGDHMRAVYALDADRITVGPPPFTPLDHLAYDASARDIVCFGRLAEVKGQQDLLAAAIPVLRTHSATRLRFLHQDGWSLAEDRSMRAALEDRIPDDLTDRVFFEEIQRDGLGDAVAGAALAVVPSRFESFCLAAHELRSLGLPLLVADLPAYEGLLDETTGAARYDGSVPDLTRRLEELLDDPDRRARLAAARPPQIGDPLSVYRLPPVPVRPAGARQALATRASTYVAEARPPDPPRRPLQRILRVVPRPLARLAVRVLPQRLKDRFRDVADWRAEDSRRTDADRRSAVRQAIASGAFPELPEPLTTVVIPCFDQGAFLDDAILSVFEQTSSDFEIVVVDDGSTDQETIEAIDALDWPRLRVIRQENTGLPGARNAGIRAARGRFIVPLDADDALEPGFLEALGGALEDHPEAAYAHCWGRYMGDMDAYWITRPFNPYQLLLSNSVLGCVLLRKEAWEAVGGYDDTMTEGNEDWDLWLRLYDAGWDQVQVRRPLHRYRVHGRTMSVDTLARLDAARLDLRRRNADLYARAAELKTAHAPWATVLRSPDVPGPSDDMTDRDETTPDGLDAALASTSGKVVVEWDLLADPPPDALRRLAQALEDHPDRAVATAMGVPVAWRRWALHDPAAPLTGSVETGLRAVENPMPRLSAGIAPRDEWTAPDDLPDPELEVIRQPLDEEGPLPAWLA